MNSHPEQSFGQNDEKNNQEPSESEVIDASHTQQNLAKVSKSKFADAVLSSDCILDHQKSQTFGKVISSKTIMDETTEIESTCSSNNWGISGLYSSVESPLEDELLAELETEFFSAKAIFLPSADDSNESFSEYKVLKNKLDAIQRRLEHTLNQRKVLEVENTRLEQKVDAAIKQTNCIKSELESVIIALEKDNNNLKAKITMIEEKSKMDLCDLENEHRLKMEQLTKLYEDCVCEKDAAVVRYAQAEQKNIDVQDRLQKAETRVKEWTKEREIALTKWHAMKADLKKSNELNQSLAAEVATLRKECEKQKELASSSDVKVKWQQNKIKVEQDTVKETITKLQETKDKLKELNQEELTTLDQIKLLFLVLQEVDDGKVPVEIVQKKNFSDFDELLSTIRKGLRLLEMKEREIVAELQTLRDKVRCLEVERLSQEESLNSIKDNLYTQQQENVDLQARIMKLEKTEKMLYECEKVLSDTTARVHELESLTQDQKIEIEHLVKREAEQLEFASRISEKNTQLIAENSRFAAEILAVKGNLEELKVHCRCIEDQNKILTEDLTELRNKAAAEIQNLEEMLKNEEMKLNEVQLKLEETEDEIKTLKRRHGSNIKDLTRQLQIANRHVTEGRDLGSSGKTERDNASLGSLGSHGGSCGSLEMAGLMSSGTNEQPVQYEERKTQDQNGKDLLLEKVVSLERTLHHKSEKVEFLKDHVHQLTEELNRKSRIIQGYVLREEAGTLAPESSDKNKAQLTKKKGVMASLYASHALDDSMTMGLSLEINRKLQALLEDTLLKNIKLKEGMDTLGQEIDWLSQENKRLHHELERVSDQSAA